jgi:hypothetical protein
MTAERGSGPIFVGGLDRSGTSLMYALLASHPEIAMTRRTNWWTYFHGRFGDLAKDEQLDRLLDEMLRYRRHRKLEPDRDRLRTAFRAGPPRDARMFALMEEQFAERLGRSRWGDKSLHTERYAAQVYEEFPSASILHMVRDPRDRYASVLKRWKRVRGGVGGATAAWLASVALGDRNASRYPDRYRVVRYEDLAARPVEVMQEICAFIGAPFEPVMMEMRGAETFREAGNSSYGAIPEGTISTRSIGRYREVMRPADTRFLQGRAGQVMLAHGYALDRVEMSAAETLRYGLVELPLQSARMAAWRSREWIRDRLGRAAPGHTMLEGDR